jgi:tRNA(Ile)-lysidine synthase
MEIKGLLSIFHNLEFPLEGKTIVLGVSGGADSICLMDLFSQLKIHLIVAHFNHQLRKESFNDARFVQHQATSLHFPFETGSEEVRKLAKKMHRSVEEQGRISRYEFLFRIAEQYKADAVAVAHNADDQVETILMHFLRGCGLAGLRGMTPINYYHPWKSRIPLIRPLLSIKKAEILEYCNAKHLEFVEDASNRDSAFFRNRIRNELIPLLETYNPKLKNHLLSLGNIAQTDYQLLENFANPNWQDCMLEIGQNFVLLNAHKILLLPQSQSRWIVQRVFHHLKPEDREIDFASVARFLEFIQSPSRTGKIDWIKNITLTLDDTTLYACDQSGPALDFTYPQINSEYIHWTGTGEVALSKKYAIRGKIIKLDGDVRIPVDSAQAWMDLDTIRTPIVIRRWKFGDRFEPFGFAGRTVKLSDFWNNAHLPKRARKNYPVLESGGQIIWIPGLRLAQSVAVSDKTKKMLILSLIKK